MKKNKPLTDKKGRLVEPGVLLKYSGKAGVAYDLVVSVNVNEPAAGYGTFFEVKVIGLQLSDCCTQFTGHATILTLLVKPEEFQEAWEVISMV